MQLISLKKYNLAITLAFVVAIGGIAGIAYATPDGSDVFEAPAEAIVEGAVTEGTAQGGAAYNAQVIAGNSQYDTSAEQAVAAFPEGSSYAIIASGTIPVDALAASSLAGALECPILLTAKDELPSSISLALTTLNVENVIIVGGPAVIGESVEQALGEKCANIERLYGDSQYDTQLKIYAYGDERGIWDESDTLIVASGISVSAADALSASPIAYRMKAPVILVDSTGRIPSATAAAFAAEDQYTRALVVGGKAVVSDVSYGYMAALTMLNSGEENVIRLAGNTLYDTSAAVAEWAVEQGVLSWDKLAFATGKTPFDSLGGSVMQGVSGSVLLLIDPGYLVGLDAAAEHADAILSVVFFGGESVMSADLRNLICEALFPVVQEEPSDPEPPAEGEDSADSGPLGDSVDSEGAEDLEGSEEPVDADAAAVPEGGVA